MSLSGEKGTEAKGTEAKEGAMAEQRREAGSKRRGLFANVILSITNESVDRPFTYAVPEELEPLLSPGTAVKVPFGKGNHLKTAYVLSLQREAPPGSFAIKEIAGCSEKEVSAEEKLMELAIWMKEHYGCMLHQALKTVLPVKQRVQRRKRTEEELLPEEAQGPSFPLTPEQRAVISRFQRDRTSGRRERYLLYGVTGSGKTEVYAEMIRETLREGQQAILMLPEISLTFQTVRRLRQLFGSRVAIIHSKLSAGERYEQFRRAATGEADIVVGPRSAVFAPFEELGLIIVDEEHDGAYKNDTVPRFETRDVAEKRAELASASLVLGSATPSATAWSRAKQGDYVLLEMRQRAVSGARPATVHVVDLREELRGGNRSVFSGLLQRLISDRLRKGEQSILFMNRRGYSHFVSCRSCGNAIRCPHCDVSLTLHKKERLICHYCGYTIPLPKRCPDCGSPFIAAFGTGTQKLEALTEAMFPKARVLRMDSDAAAGKHAGHDILKAFRDGEADILIGTQMVVKGHDFPNVTLVGIMAADTELYVSSYTSAERTFQLLTQAAGRAGRGTRPGDVVIQTYRPEHYAIRSAAAQDFRGFMEAEMAYREAGGYPPALHLLTVQLSSQNEMSLVRSAAFLETWLEQRAKQWGAAWIGPVDAGIYKVHDYFRKLFYIKHSSYDILLDIKNGADSAFHAEFPRGISALYDFS